MKRGHGPGDKSRMSREAPVRFREGLGATRLVVLARYQCKRRIDGIERTLEGRFQLTINREKTRIVKMQQPDASLTFLSFTLLYDLDRYGRGCSFLNVFPSAKARARAREKLRDLTDHHRCSAPIPEVINEVNRWLAGWGNYSATAIPAGCSRRGTGRSRTG